MKKFIDKKIVCYILLLVFSICCSFLFVNGLTKSTNEVVTITFLNPIKGKCDLYYDNLKEEYPFSEKGEVVTSQQKETELVFNIPAGRSNKLRLDFYKSKDGQPETVYLQGIKVNSFGKEKNINAQEIFQSFIVYPEADVSLSENQECVIIKFDSDVILFENHGSILGTVKKDWMKYIVVIILALILSVTIDLIVYAVFKLWKKLEKYKVLRYELLIILEAIVISIA